MHQLKAQHHYFHLNVQFSGEYLFNEQFRKKFQTRYSPARLHVCYPIAQLQSSLRSFTNDNVVRGMQHVHSLTLTTELMATQHNPLDATANVYASFDSVWHRPLPRRWELRYCTLSVGACEFLAALPDLGHLGVGSVTMCGEMAHLFQHIPSLDLSRTEIVDLAPLSRCLKLNLESNFCLQNVAPLANLQWLCLKHCYALRDVSALGKVRHLELDSCIALESLAGLGQGNKYVSLQFCTKIRDFSPLATVPVLDLSSTNIADLTPLGKVQRLMLRHCCHLDKDTLGALAHVPFVDLSYTRLGDYSRLGNNHLMLRLAGCGIRDASWCAGVPYLDLMDNLLTSADMLGGCVWLELSDNPIADVTCLANVCCLSIGNCCATGIANLAGVEKLCLNSNALSYAQLMRMPRLKVLLLNGEWWKPHEFFSRRTFLSLTV